jgi:HEPN domain-containing protein
MKPITQEWIEKAEGDWNAARQLFRVRKDPNYDGVCFHCQQSVEKYLKARLEEASIAFSKTHELNKLLVLVLAVEPNWLLLNPFLQGLNNYAVSFRYPGNSATKQIAKDAITDCRLVRRIIRQAFGLPV